jgi:NAD+ diphosphatase
MIPLELPESFELTFSPTEEQSAEDLWFIFRGDELLVIEAADRASIPSFSDLSELKLDFLRTHFLGKLNGVACYLGEVVGNPPDIEGMAFLELRPLLGRLGDNIFAMAGRAFQILHWDRTHQFCGRCGSRTKPKGDERAKICDRCGLVTFPDVSPAIIVAIVRGSEILLARSPRFKYDFYSVLAGFVEPGETFEQCVRREVGEEVGIEVANIKYFASQPWPFPNTLMVGFTAEHAGGEIVIDEAEISTASWFTSDKLPPIPRIGSIARSLIDWFVGKYGQQR